MTSQPQCAGTTKGGEPCRAFAPSGSRYCVTHDPERAGERREARAKGGAAASKLRMLRGRRAKLATAPELVAFTAGVIQDVVGGTLAPDVARVVLYGISIQRQLVEASDLERRIAELEARGQAG